MKIIIPGGSGQVGAVLVRSLGQMGHQVLLLGRGAKRMVHGVPCLAWDGKSLGAWSKEIDGADAVINLVGRSVNCRYTPANRREIMDSRLDSTRVIGQAIAAAKKPPATWLQAATATIYSHRFDGDNDDLTGIIGGDESNAPDTWKFSITVAKAWEAALFEADTPQTRKVALRSAMVMDPYRKGVFDTLLTLVRLGLGGSMGNGQQYLSWVHDQDFARAIAFLLEQPDLSGPINIASPNPLPNREFMRLLRQTAKVPFGLSSSRWMLEIGSFLLQSETELVLKSRRVTAKRLADAGFVWQFADWANASHDLYERWRALRSQ
jgi:uncharacterized protein